ncbi:lysine-specific demethylase 5B-B-like [Epinephelus fuscoguttatus]|uniref:lysine-specific demethylase 5B-B-like n=1 Tax=Epinephelus fuscoguttatus TaxID=293821 RepID=UPI0020D098C5|nr:lysine-specific demethylase 5B-B-like [Epinephelus fuscoguttatus]
MAIVKLMPTSSFTASTSTIPPAAASTSSTPPSVSPASDTCPTCNQHTKNYLVEAGLIPHSLAKILTTPTFGQKAGGVWRRLPLQARVITSDEYVAHLDRLEAEEKEKEEQKKKRKAELERKRGEKKTRKCNPSLDSAGHCAICRNTAPPGLDADIDEWVQCELCQVWFHLVCVDMDDVPDGEWLCHKCSVNVVSM